MSKRKILGILGGLGPMSSAYFYRMITEHTFAKTDNEHIDLILSSHSSTPDRTAFITGRSDNDPLPVMINDAKKLVNFGAEIIAIPCNTAHYFYDEIKHSVDVPVINIIYETVKHIAALGVKKVGILATEGTVLTHTYQGMCESMELQWAVPDKKSQDVVSNIIYSTVKSGITPKESDNDVKRFIECAHELEAQGCGRLILGCTELSVFAQMLGLQGIFTDALEVLTYRTIIECGAVPVGFPADYKTGELIRV